MSASIPSTSRQRAVVEIVLDREPVSSQSLLEAQKHSLQLVVSGAPLKQVLAYLTRIVEERSESRAIAAILLLDRHGCLRIGAAPSLPDDYNNAVDGLKACAEVGTCCAAAATGLTVITRDIEADPKWRGLRHLPLALGLKSAWSRPIISRDGRVLGTFGTYFRECREPTQDEREVVEVLSRTAALAIERQRAEVDRQQVFSLAESSGEFIGMCDMQMKPFYVNSAGLRMVGLDSLEEARQTSVADYFFPEDRELIFGEFFARVLRDGRGEIETRFRHFKTGRPIDIIYSVTALADDSGDISGFGTVTRDITEQKRAAAELQLHRHNLEQLVQERTAELIRSHERLRTAERMAAVGTFASGLTHDMSNVLLPLSVRLDMLLAHSAVDGAIHEHLVAVQGLLTHLREMARNLSLFSRDPEQEGIVGQTDLDDWSERTWRLIEASLRLPDAGVRPIVLTCDIPAGLPQAAIAPHRLTQAILNLMNNARDAVMLHRERKPEISGIGRIAVQARAASHADTGAPVVRIQVIDDGVGMDAQTRHRCIEPFFTTRTRPNAAGASGSGLGLALVNTIVERAGGSMTIESEPGQGTTVTLELPVVAPLA